MLYNNHINQEKRSDMNKIYNMLCVTLVLLGVFVVMGATSVDVYTISEMILYSMLGFSAMAAGMLLHEDVEDEKGS